MNCKWKKFKSSKVQKVQKVQVSLSEFFLVKKIKKFRCEKFKKQMFIFRMFWADKPKTETHTHIETVKQMSQPEDKS